MLEVLRNDDIRVAANGSGKHMAVASIWQREGTDERLVAGDEAVAHMGVHQLPHTRQLNRIKVGTVCCKVPRPFIVNFFRPATSKQIPYRQLHENVPQRGWVEDAGVEDDRSCCVHQ